MNAAYHIPEDLLEQYAMGTLPDPESAPVEEHILLCSECQARLQEIDEFLLAIQGAAAALLRQPREAVPWRGVSRPALPLTEILA